MVAVAFFGAVVAVLLLRSMTPHDAYQAVEWPVLVLLGALIPISETVSSTGGADLIAANTQAVQGNTSAQGGRSAAGAIKAPSGPADNYP